MNKTIEIKMHVDTSLINSELRERIESSLSRITFDRKIISIFIRDYSPFCHGCNDPSCRDCFVYD